MFRFYGQILMIVIETENFWVIIGYIIIKKIEFSVTTSNETLNHNSISGYFPGYPFYQKSGVAGEGKPKA